MMPAAAGRGGFRRHVPRRVASGAAAVARPGPLARVAIVDSLPAEQYLAPEFELFRRLVRSERHRALVADPAELSFDGERLRVAARRSTWSTTGSPTFALAEPQHASPAPAYLADAVVLTPHPQTHALFADKRNLVALGDEQWLRKIGVDRDDRQLLASSIPRTEEVFPENADAFWKVASNGSSSRRPVSAARRPTAATS
jgi:hypothetical protein